MKKTGLLIGLSCISFSSFAAIDLTDNVTLSGFGSTSWAKSDNSSPLMTNREIANDSCFDCDTTLGMQLDFFYDEFKASAQMVKRPQDEWSDPQLEWAYVAYTLDNTEFRGGILRLPIFLMSEYYYVGHAYTSTRPPVEVYNSLLGITSFNGLSMVSNFDLNDDYQLMVTPYIGFTDSSEVNYSSVETLKFKTQKLVGINLLLSEMNYRVNFSYFDATYDQEAYARKTGQYFGTSKDERIQLYSLGFEYDFDSASTMIEGQVNDYSSSWYIKGQYNLSQFTPYAVFGQNFNEDNQKISDSYTAGVRYDITHNVSLNAEWQYFNTLRGRGEFIETPQDNDAHLYTIMLNFVF